MSFEISSNINIPRKSNTFKYEDKIQPFLNMTVKKIAWSKFLNGTGHIISFHSRKAAGTTLETLIKRMLHLPSFQWIKLKTRHNVTNRNYKYWERYIKQHNISWNFTFESYEAFSFLHDEKHKNKISEIMKRNPYAIYIMTFRDPIDRILSQYEFEIRWGCFKCNAKNTKLIQQYSWDKRDKYNYMDITTFMKNIKINQSALNKKQINDLNKYKFSNIEFEDFIRRVDTFEINNNLAGDRWSNSHKIGYAAYLNNYYLWIFCCNYRYCNIKKHFEDKGKIQECYDNAIAKIKSFDIIMTSEWMNDLRNIIYINQLIFNKFIQLNSFEDKLFVDMIPIPFRHFVNNKGKNYMLNTYSYNKLIEWNKWDLKLYKFVKYFIFKREKEIWSKYGGKLLYNQTFKQYLNPH